MVLTILDRRPYKIKNGPNAGKVIKSSKKLFKVKGRNLAKFQRQYERRKGKWRGLRVLCRRDGEKDAAIGEDLEFLAVVPEVTLVKYGDSAVPANYESIFAAPTAEELAKRHKIKGSSVAGSEEFGEGDDYGDEDVGWDADDTDDED